MSQFLQLTPREYYLALKDNEKILLSTTRPVCEAIRMSTWWLANLQITQKSKKIRKPEKIMRFIWDDDYKEPQTLKQMKNVMKFIAAATKDNKKRKRR